MRRRRYVPDLVGFEQECALNYVRLSKLMQALPIGEARAFQLAPQQLLILRYQADHKYTAELTLELDMQQASRWIPAMTLEVRLYRDAALAEVLSATRLAKLQPIFKYPNDFGALPNEKMQLNRQLGDWLAKCLETGYSCDPLGVFSR